MRGKGGRKRNCFLGMISVGLGDNVPVRVAVSSSGPRQGCGNPCAWVCGPSAHTLWLAPWVVALGFIWAHSAAVSGAVGVKLGRSA